MIEDVSAEQGWSPDGAHSGYIDCLLMLGFIGVSLHTLALLVGVSEGVRLFRQKRGFVYLLAATLCLVYLTGVLLETMLTAKAVEGSFYFALLLCATAVGPSYIIRRQARQTLPSALASVPRMR